MKLKLTIEDLRVDTFETDGVDAGRRGTVRANGKPVSAGGGDVCSGVWSCLPDASCGNTCALSCNATCLQTYGECCPEA